MKTLIIDNYDSFTYNLYQFIGDLGGNPRVYRNDEITLKKINYGNYSHAVISPGPGSPEDDAYFGISKEVILNLGKKVPVLGVCLGHQGIIFCFGGRIIRAAQILHGKKSLIRHNGRGIFQGVKNPLLGMRYHSLIGERSSLPAFLEITAQTADGTIMGVRHSSFPIFGLQFHPESVGTEDGHLILKNFLECAI